MDLNKIKVDGPFQKATTNLYTFGDNYMILYTMAGLLEVLERASDTDEEVSNLLEKLITSNVKQICEFMLKRNNGIWD